MKLPFVSARFVWFSAKLELVSLRSRMPDGNPNECCLPAANTLEAKIAEVAHAMIVHGDGDGPLYMAEALAGVSCCNMSMLERPKLYRLTRFVAERSE